MNFHKKLLFSALAGVSMLVSIIGCEEDPTTLGNGVISGEPFSASKATYDVFAFNKKINSVQTNNLPVYQLGIFNDPVYGKTQASVTTQLRLASGNPTFGSYSQSTEDEADTDTSILTIKENETVTSVYLYIPFLTETAVQRDSDGDGVDDDFDTDPDDIDNDNDSDGLTNNEERILGSNPLNEDTDGDGVLDAIDDDMVANAYPKKFALDSIYTNASELDGLEFDIKVERSTYFLRELDPDENFEQAQAYYSDRNYSPDFVSDVLFDGTGTISNIEYITFNDDDPETEDTDESREVDTRFNPGIRVPLDNAFFQENILDKEGASELLSQTNFQDFLRGVHVSIPSSADDIMFLLDFSLANITVNYNYDKVNTNDTADDTSDDTIDEIESQYLISLSGLSGRAVNTFVNEDYPADITNRMNTGTNADRIYLKGGAGAFAEINLFDAENGRDIIEEIKANNWIINEANLVFYIDRNTLDAAGDVIEPPRLYLYNTETNLPLYVVQNDISENESALGVLLNHDGLLSESSDNKGEKYTIRITEYINNLVIRDEDNVTLGLAVTSDIRFAAVRGAMLKNDTGSTDIEGKSPIYATINPFGTVLYGSNVALENEDKKLKLEIFYTETN